jgi:hypothetical protein
MIFYDKQSKAEAKPGYTAEELREVLERIANTETTCDTKLHSRVIKARNAVAELVRFLESGE